MCRAVITTASFAAVKTSMRKVGDRRRWATTAGAVDGCCSANEQVRGRSLGCALDARTSAKAFRPQGAVLPAENQDASHHPLIAPQLR